MLGPIYGMTIIPQWPPSDGLGNLIWVDRDPIANAVFDLGAPSSSGDSLYSQSGSLFVPRGSVIRNGDRITYQGRTFVAVGEPLWDMDHPLTGEDFGYVEVHIQW